MNNTAIKANKGYSIGTASYAFDTTGYGTITEGGFRKATKIEVTWDGTTWTTTNEVQMNEYNDNERYSSVSPRHSWEGDTRFRILPFNTAGTARFSFGKLATQLVNDTDELPVIFRAYTTSCINYVLFRAYANDTKPDLAQQYRGYFKEEKQDFINEITPRDATGPKTIEFVEGLSGMNEGLTYTGDWII